MLITTSRQYRQQKPLLGARIDLSSELTSGLAGLWLFNEGTGAPSNLLTGIVAQQSDATAPTWGIDSTGPTGVFARTGGWEASRKAIISGQNSYTIMVRFSTIQSGLSYTQALYSERASSGNDIVKLDFENASPTGNQPRLVLTVRNDAGNLIQFPGSRAMNDGRIHTGVCTVTGRVGSLYLDGLFDQSTSNVPTGTFTDPVESRIGSDAGDGNALWNGTIGFVGIWNRALSAREITILSTDPYACCHAPRSFSVSYPINTFLPRSLNRLINNAVYRM